MSLTRLRELFLNNQIVLVLLALIAGAMFPAVFKPLAQFQTPLLMAIFFASSLRLNPKETLSYAKDWRLMLVANLVMLILIPLAMWFPLYLFAPDWALAFLIVGAMPTGLTIALIADLFGGKTSLAMLISVTTSLLAPITVPIVFLLAVGRTIPIPVLTLFGSLFITIVIPFAGAMAVRSKYKNVIKKHDTFWRELSLSLFVLLLAAVVADTVTGEAIHIGWGEFGILSVMLVYMGGIGWLSYAITNWRTTTERVTVALCMLYMNNTLALYVGNTFFKEAHVIPKLLLILTAVNILLLPIKWAATSGNKKYSGRKERQLEAPVI